MNKINMYCKRCNKILKEKKENLCSRCVRVLSAKEKESKFFKDMGGRKKS